MDKPLGNIVVYRLLCVQFHSNWIEIMQSFALAKWTIDEPNIDLSDPVASCVICIALHCTAQIFV